MAQISKVKGSFWRIPQSHPSVTLETYTKDVNQGRFCVKYDGHSDTHFWASPELHCIPHLSLARIQHSQSTRA